MSSVAARDLSVPDLLHLLNEKIGLECASLRGISLPPALSTASLESEVSPPRRTRRRGLTLRVTVQIESLETRVHEVLQLIPSLRNLLRPINKLPPEILSYIACEGAKDTEEMISLTHVCRYWRESIISTPTNWTSISSKSRSTAALSLQRAKAAPLELNIGDYYIAEGHWLPDLLIPYIQNIETLNVGQLKANELKGILPNFPQSVPNLQSLSLTTYSRSDWALLPDPFESFPPTLKHLTLTSIPLYPSLLELRGLTELNIDDSRCYLSLDTLLDFLEGNRSLTRATLRVQFAEPPLRTSQRWTPIKTQLQYLEITCYDAMDGQALVSGIALPKGAELELRCEHSSNVRVRVNDVLSGISTTHLSNLLSPTFMEYRAYPRSIRLSGPNGIVSFNSESGSGPPLVELPRLPLASIRQFHLDTWRWELIGPPTGLTVLQRLLSFPALETFTVGCDTDLSHLSTLLSNPSASPSLKTLGFLDCVLTEEFMQQLTQFASGRKKTTSARLHRVVIAQLEGRFPSITSIRALEEHVPVVDVRIATELPTDLT